MAKELMEHDPPVVRRVLVFLELLRLGSINERILFSLALGDHPIGNDHILETILLPDVVILQLAIVSRQKNPGESIWI